MNREIKFRGKMKSKQWIYGYLYKDNDRTYILTEKDVYYVIPETVGQFTGLFDKNGKEIYEGDIILSNHGKTKFVIIGGVRGYCYDACPTDEYPNMVSGGRGASAYHIITDHGECEIISNIFDNPELINK